VGAGLVEVSATVEVVGVVELGVTGAEGLTVVSTVDVAAGRVLSVDGRVDGCSVETELLPLPPLSFPTKGRQSFTPDQVRTAAPNRPTPVQKSSRLQPDRLTSPMGGL
jgi:hypothetical protein